MDSYAEELYHVGMNSPRSFLVAPMKVGLG